MFTGNSEHPVYRTALAVDVEGSTTRTNRAKAVVRDVMYRLVTEALAVHGIGDDDIGRLVDRGDGLLALIRPADSAPKTLLIGSVVPTLGALLTRYNDEHPDAPLRLRCVVHAGEVHFDRHGQYGEMLDVAFRLLDAPRVKRALRRAAGPLVLVISDDLYWSVVHHGYGSVAALPFAPLVAVRVADLPRQGWLHVPGEPPPVPRVGVPGPRPVTLPSAGSPS